MAFATYTWQNGSSAPLLPTTPEPTDFEIAHRRTVVVSDGRSGRRVTRQVGGERIEVRLRYPPMHKSAYAPLLAFLRYVGDRNTIFALRFPILTSGPSGYGDATGYVGEYYNINHVTNNNQLVQLLDNTGSPPIVAPQDRSGLNPVLSTWPTYLPTLKCSLNSDVVEVDYGEDGFVRIEFDVVERW